MATEAQKKAIARYQATLGRMNLRPSKELDEAIRAHAASRGESLQAFMLRAAKEQMARDNAETGQ